MSTAPLSPAQAVADAERAVVDAAIEDFDMSEAIWHVRRRTASDLRTAVVRLIEARRLVPGARA